MKKDYQISRVLRLISGVLLFLALGYHPYSYYIVLRWIIFLSSFYSGWVLSKLEKHNWSWIFLIVGILFNPIIPVYLDRGIWQIIDVVVALTFMFSLSVKHKQKN